MQQTPGFMQTLAVNLFSWIASMINSAPGIATDGVSAVSTSISFMVQLVSAASMLIPVVDIFIIIGLIQSARIAAFSLWVINWIIRRVLDAVP